jgi:hypothetical protein
MNVPIKAGSLFLLFGHLDSSEVGQIKESPGADQNGTKLRAIWDVFRSEAKGDRIQKPRVSTLIIRHSLSAGKRSPSATIDCLEKYRSPVRTKYSLEGYATLRSHVAAVGSRR